MDSKIEPRNIFEQILFGVSITNENVVELAKELAQMRTDLESMAKAMRPSLKSADDGSETKPADKTKKK